MTATTGVIGLGALGAPIAGLLLKAGFRVCVYDVREEPMAVLQKLGAARCASPAERSGCPRRPQSGEPR